MYALNLIDVRKQAKPLITFDLCNGLVNYLSDNTIPLEKAENIRNINNQLNDLLYKLNTFSQQDLSNVFILQLQELLTTLTHILENDMQVFKHSSINVLQQVSDQGRPNAIALNLFQTEFKKRNPSVKSNTKDKSNDDNNKDQSNDDSFEEEYDQEGEENDQDENA